MGPRTEAAVAEPRGLRRSLIATAFDMPWTLSMSRWLLWHHWRLHRARPPKPSSRPLAVAKHRHAPAVGVNAIDVGLVRTDHPVDVDQALVAALCRDLLRAERGTIDEAF